MVLEVALQNRILDLVYEIRAMSQSKRCRAMKRKLYNSEPSDARPVDNPPLPLYKRRKSARNGVTRWLTKTP